MPKRPRDEDLEVGDAPTEINPYQVLEVDEQASQDEIKRAYRKAALKHHPDKATPDDKVAAHSKFQEIAFAFAILSDERRRRRYDTTGRTAESIDIEDDDFDWITYYREQFAGVVTEATISKFADEYKGSEEERGHILAAYDKGKGSMVKVYQNVMLSDMVDDEDRFRAIIDQAIEDGDVPAHKAYTNESDNARRKRMEHAKKRKDKESKEAEQASLEIEESRAKKKGKKTQDPEDLGTLAALIQQRQRGRAEGFFERLEAKYASTGKLDKRDLKDEPPEEAFTANRKSKSSKK